MKLFKKFVRNCRKPATDFWGKMMLAGMNYGHNKMALWCIDKCIRPSGKEDILDIGCGGGQNIANFLARTTGKVCGADYSAQSVAKSIAKNRRAVRYGRAEITEASVSSLPYESESFDLVTAFETIYFWPNIIEDFMEVSRLLKPGGKFVVCNEMARKEGNKLWISLLDMKIYTSDEIVEIMTKSGFTQTSVFTEGNHICVVGYK